MAEQSLTSGALRPQQHINCRTCGLEIPKVSSGHRYCAPCSRAGSLERKRLSEMRKNRLRGMREIGAETRCATCSTKIVRTGGNRRYCDPCSAAKIKADKLKQARAEKAKDPEAARVRSRRYYQKNRERLLAETKSRMESSPQARLSARMGGLMWWCLRHKKAGKSWAELVPYSVEELAAHLERQFLPGMTWQNFGKWEVDHILPRRMFDYTEPTDPDFAACWALTNLRPLWKSENCAKGGRRLLLL